MCIAGLNVQIDVFIEHDVRINLIAKPFLQKNKINSQGLNAIFFDIIETGKGVIFAIKHSFLFFFRNTSLFEVVGKSIVWIAFHVFLNMVIADKIDMVGIRSFFSKGEISLQTPSERYFVFRARIVS